MKKYTQISALLLLFGFTIVAFQNCSGGGDLSLYTNPSTSGDLSKLSANISTVDFGSLAVGASSNQTITITNDSDETLSALAIADLIGLSFDVETDNCTTMNLAPDESCTFTLSFTPAAAQLYMLDYKVLYDDADGRQEFVLPLMGQGI